MVVEKAVWDDQYNLGVEAIDTSHTNLFPIVRKLMVLVQDEANSESACMEGLKYLENYTTNHFFE